MNIVTVGLNTPDPLPGVSIYPNPGKGIVHIQLGTLKDVSINIYSIQGQKIFAEGNINTTEYNLETGMSSGIYIIEVASQGQIQRYRMVSE